MHTHTQTHSLVDRTCDFTCASYIQTDSPSVCM